MFRRSLISFNPRNYWAVYGKNLDQYRHDWKMYDELLRQGRQAEWGYAPPPPYLEDPRTGEIHYGDSEQERLAHASEITREIRSHKSKYRPIWFTANVEKAWRMAVLACLGVPGLVLVLQIALADGETG